MPGDAAVGGVIQTLVARSRQARAHQRAFIGLRNRGYNQLRIDRAPGKAGETFPLKTQLPAVLALYGIGGFLYKAPGVPAVGRAQNPGAIVRVQRVVRVPGAGQNHARSARLHRQGADADRRILRVDHARHRVCEWNERHVGRVRQTGVLRHPHPAPGGSHEEKVAGRVRGIQRQRGDPARDQAIVRRNYGGWAQRLPCNGAPRLGMRPGCHRSPLQSTGPAGHNAPLGQKAPCLLRLWRQCGPVSHIGHALAHAAPWRQAHRCKSQHAQRHARSRASRRALPGSGHTPSAPASHCRFTGSSLKSRMGHTRPLSASGLPSHILRGGFARIQWITSCETRRFRD